MKFRLLCLIAAFCLMGSSAIPDAGAQEGSAGRIDWVQGFITAIGSGAGKGSNNPAQDKALAIRMAKIDAQKVLLETVKGVRIDSHTRVDMMMVSEDVINTRMEGFIKEAQSARQDIRIMNSNNGRQYPAATVELRLCLTNAARCCKSSISLISVLSLEDKKLPGNIPQLQFSAVPPMPAPSLDSPSLPDVRKPDIPGIDPTKPVTGVIITLGGRFFEREIMPVVLTVGEDQKLMTVYSAKRVKSNAFRIYGVVHYADNLDQARKISYIGDNALIIPAVNVTNDNLIVISVEDAQKIGETTRPNNDYLGEGRVVISSN